MALSAAGVDLGSTIQVNPDPGAGTRTISSTAASGSTALSGTVNMNRDLTVLATSGSSLSINNINLSNSGNNDLTVNNSSAVAINGVITAATGASDLTKTGSGLLTIAGNNTGSNYKLNVNQGTVRLTHANALGNTASYVGKVNFASSSGTLQVGTSVATSAGVTMTVASGITGHFDVDASQTFTLNGTITGAGGNIRKEGAGTMIIGSGHTSTYTGSTVVNAGTLVVNGSIASSSGVLSTAAQS